MILMVYDMICQGKTEGVFQLESGGMKSVYARAAATHVWRI